MVNWSRVAPSTSTLPSSRSHCLRASPFTFSKEAPAAISWRRLSSAWSTLISEVASLSVTARVVARVEAQMALDAAGVAAAGAPVQMIVRAPALPWREADLSDRPLPERRPKPTGWPPRNAPGASTSRSRPCCGCC
ncbi:hypothetical protein SFUMM280S_02780 [Streptomyces fumanus]